MSEQNLDHPCRETCAGWHQAHASGVNSIKDLVYVPGLFECSKCLCVLCSQTLYMKSGTIGSNDKPQTCPNECGPMWRVTWKKRAQDLLIALEDEVTKRMGISP